MNFFDVMVKFGEVQNKAEITSFLRNFKNSGHILVWMNVDDHNSPFVQIICQERSDYGGGFFGIGGKDKRSRRRRIRVKL